MPVFLRMASMVLAALTGGSGLVLAQPGTEPPAASAAAAASRIAAAAEAFVATLDAPARQKIQFPFDGPQKARWSNFPTGIFQREGIRLGDLTPPQRAAAMKLLAAALSTNGYRKVTDIMKGDEVLRTRPRGGGGVVFGEDEYYLAFFGTPSATAPWMLQFGGHHLAINLTMAGSQATLAPSLPGTQPGRFTIEGREIRPLGKESDTAFLLINALSESQRGQAILKSRVADLVLGPGQDGRTIQPEGLRASAMAPAQQAMLLDIVQEWAGIMVDEFARPRMAEVKAALGDTYFAWSGDITPGSPSYFRIQGPTLVIEFAPQGSLDHIHGIYRDPTNDYGAGIARP